MTKKKTFLSLPEISALLMLSKQRIGQLRKIEIEVDGEKIQVIPEPINHKYDLTGCVHGYVQYLAQLNKGSGTLNLTAARTVTQNLINSQKELDLDRDKEKLVHIESIWNAWTEVLQSFRQVILFLNKNFSQEFADIVARFVEKKFKVKISEKETKGLRIEIQEKLKKDSYSALKELSNFEFTGLRDTGNEVVTKDNKKDTIPAATNNSEPVRGKKKIRVIKKQRAPRKVAKRKNSISA